MPLTYREALDVVVATGSRGMKVGLERTRALLTRVGDPHLGLRGVLVGGTNGKGSVCAMVESACRAAGLRTALLVKPHLTSYRERVVLDGVRISGEGFASLVEELIPAIDAVEPEAGAPTQFEILTVLGILAARRHGSDVVVCEVGMGGTLDSTNVLDLGVAVLTNVALDHRQYLGETVPAIATDKAGIIKPGNDVVTGATGEGLAVIRARAAERGAPRLLAFGDGIRHRGRSLGEAGVEVEVQALGMEVTARVPLHGSFQADNAAVAVAACAAMASRGLPLDAAAVAAGLGGVQWRGRLQWVAGQPPLLVDGAHNPAAVEAIVPAVGELVGDRPLVALVGVMADKDVAGILDALRPLRALPVFTQAGTPRATSAVELARLWGNGARAVPSLPDALSAARMLAADDGVVLVCGSLYLAGDVLRLVERPDR